MLRTVQYGCLHAEYVLILALNVKGEVVLVYLVYYQLLLSVMSRGRREGRVLSYSGFQLLLGVIVLLRPHTAEQVLLLEVQGLLRGFVRCHTHCNVKWLRNNADSRVVLLKDLDLITTPTGLA